MAKGNDGNYLQHCIEVEAATRLAQMDIEGRLHVALTHGMEPFERFEKSKPNQQRELLQKALDASKAPPQFDEPAIVAAYRKTKASKEHYPNSAELSRIVVGIDKMSGGITEIKSEKHQSLEVAWSDSNVKPSCSSWRKEVHPGGVLACPGDLQRPWLFSMDPMTYRENSNEDDDKLHRCDIDSLSIALNQYVRSGQPGIAALFVYNVNHKVQTQFWQFVDDLAKRISADTYSYWLTHRRGSRNLAGLFYSGIVLSSGFTPACLNTGRGI